MGFAIDVVTLSMSDIFRAAFSVLGLYSALLTLLPAVVLAARRLKPA